MSDTIPQYSKVRLTTNRFGKEGAPHGSIGWIIEIHSDAAGPAYEVEVMDDDGHTLAVVVLRLEELEVIADH